MATMTECLLNQLQEANRQFLLGSPKYLDSAGDSFIVISCIDPRLTGLLEPALGLPKHRAIVIRTAGNLISETGPDMLRSVAAGLYLKKVNYEGIAWDEEVYSRQRAQQRMLHSFEWHYTMAEVFREYGFEVLVGG